MAFALLFAAVLGALVTVLVASFYGQGVVAWSIGLGYLAYDAGLQVLLLVTAWRATHDRERGAGSAELSSIATSESRSPQDGGLPAPRSPLPALAVLIPCRNEVTVLPATVAALLPQLQPGDRLLVVDDGSTDGTADWCRAQGVEVLAKPNSGKADSLNQAFARVSQEIIVTIDADTVVKAGALSAIRAAFQDPRLVAAGGVLEISTRPAWLGRWLGWHQRAEYVRSFLWRAAWERWGTLLLISGAFAAYRRGPLLAVGGLATATHVEDYEVTHRLHQAALDHGHDWRLGMVPGALAVTDAPATIPLFLAQRTRWFAGFIRVHLAYRALIARPGSGLLGWLMLPLKTVDLLLPLYGLFAVAVLVAFLLFGFGLDRVIIIVLAAKVGFDLTLTWLVVRLTRRWTGQTISTGGVLAATVLEPLAFQGLRQLGALLGWISFLRRRSTWTPQR